jgi:uncharacterized protein YcbX
MDRTTLIHGLSLGKVSGLYRHAVKGLSADALENVQLLQAGTFPDDRRFALMKESSTESFDPQNPDWIHKENFLCVFTDPHLMARYRASYSIPVRRIMTCADGSGDDSKQLIEYGEPCDTVVSENIDGVSGRFLTLFERSTDERVLGPLDMSTPAGRDALADFFSEQSGIPLVCVTAPNHQFGNTSSGWKQKKDTRTIHIVTESTVKALEAAIGNNGSSPLHPTRFRPNIVLKNDDLEPFSEFDWIGKTLQCGPSSLRLEVISKTVRCQGINIDPLDPQNSQVDIPKMLAKHFPQHGPYLGVYAVVKNGGQLSLGDEVSFV